LKECSEEEKEEKGRRGERVKRRKGESEKVRWRETIAPLGAKFW
jgi:hypothetical protein